jgi:hypothetical protein
MKLLKKLFGKVEQPEVQPINLVINLAPPDTYNMVLKKTAVERDFSRVVSKGLKRKSPKY